MPTQEPPKYNPNDHPKTVVVGRPSKFIVNVYTPYEPMFPIGDTPKIDPVKMRLKKKYRPPLGDPSTK